MPRGIKPKDEVGNVYGHLLVISYAGVSGQGAQWLCECECGGTAVVLGKAMRQGKRKHCGCRGAPKKIVRLFDAIRLTGTPPCDRGCEFKEKCQVEHLACKLFKIWHNRGGVMNPNPLQYPPDEEIYAKLYGKEIED